jgi:hypothetical protein
MARRGLPECFLSWWMGWFLEKKEEEEGGHG